MMRAKYWVDLNVPYNDYFANPNGYYQDGYRRDCSGFISFVWQTGITADGGLNTSDFNNSNNYPKISEEELLPGDALVSTADGGHIVLFGGWVNSNDMTTFWGYEENSWYYNSQTGVGSGPGRPKNIKLHYRMKEMESILQQTADITITTFLTRLTVQFIPPYA